MLEQQEQDGADSDYGARITISPTKDSHNDYDNNTILLDNIVKNGMSSPETTSPNGLHPDGAVTTLSPQSSTSSTTTTTTTVKIHTTYKKRANKFMNRPNVQNGLGAYSMLHPYGVTVSSGLGSGSFGSGSGTKFLNQSSHNSSSKTNHAPQLSSLYSSSRNGSNHHRSLTTKGSLFNGEGCSGGGSITSPQGTATTASTTTTTVESRPPFVTTVTRGRFLPSKFDLMVEKSLFTFSSRPKPVGLVTKHQCSLSGGPLKENSANLNCQPRGAHDYFNVMWDPHIYRGSTTTLSSSLKQPDTDLSGRDQERYRRRRNFIAGSGQNNMSSSGSGNNNSGNLNPVGVMGPTNNRNRYRMTTKVTSRSRTFPPPEGRHQVQVQTEDYLENLTRDVTIKPEVDAIVQTDPIEDELASSYALTASNSGDAIFTKTGVDASTQVLPGELITFDERVQPIVEAVVGKILEQALLETMEEEEIGALKAQQSRFLEKRKEEERELKRLQEQQERISAEKELLKRHLELQLMRQQQQHSENGDSDDAQGLMESGSSNNIETSGIHNNSMSTAYLLELLPSVINSLRQEGLITDQIGDETLTSFVPLWMRSPSANKENSMDSPSLSVDRQDDSNDCMDEAFPEGCQSRVNSLDIVGMEQKDSISPSSKQDDDGEDGASNELSVSSFNEIIDKLIEEDENKNPEGTIGGDITEETNESAVLLEENAEAGNETNNDEEVPVVLSSQLPNGSIPNMEIQE